MGRSGGADVQFIAGLKGDGKAYINTNFYIDPLKHQAEVSFHWSKSWNRGFILGTRRNFGLYVLTAVNTITDVVVSWFSGDFHHAGFIKEGENVIEFKTKLNSYNNITPYVVGNGIVLQDHDNALGPLGWEYPLYLFACNTPNSTDIDQRRTIHSMRYLKIWERETLIHHYLPCIKPDGEAGMYDIVEGVFYGNANSEGAFIPVYE